MLMAGLDGIQNKIDPGEPLDKDIYELSPEELEGRAARRRARSTRRSRRSSSDHEFLLKGDVFTPDVDRRPGSTTSARTRSTPIRLRPHPYEFALYYDN